MNLVVWNNPVSYTHLLILEAGLISKEKLDEVLNAREMTRPGIPGMRRHKRKKEDK